MSYFYFLVAKLIVLLINLLSNQNYNFKYQNQVMAAKKQQQQQQLIYFGDYVNPLSACSSAESIDEKKPEAGTEGKGKITRNPFFNYLRLVRIKHPGVRAPDIAVIGANGWNHMTEEEKRPFREQVKLAEPKILPISFVKVRS